MPDWSEHLRAHLANLRLNPAREAEILAEWAQHLDERYEELRSAGATEVEARRLTIEELRKTEPLVEPMRALRQASIAPPVVSGVPGHRLLADLWQDLRYAARVLGKRPGFTAAAVLTLSLGIAANAAIFTLADAVLFRTLPVDRPRDLVLLRQRVPSGDIRPFTSAAARDLATTPDVLTGLAAFRPVPNAQLSVNGETELGLTQSVSGNYHQVLGVHTRIGRTLTEEDREPVAVISYRYWQRRFAGDVNALGRAVEVQGRPFTIVGVTPPGFFGTQPGRDVDVTTPLAAQAIAMPPNARWLYLIGRLSPGVSVDRARDALRARWAQIIASSPSRVPVTLELDSGAQGLNELRGQFSLPLRILMAAVGVLLLLACANLAGLLIVRSSARAQEIAIRLSLGAARGRIMRQLLTESALLAAAGATAGVALAYWLTGSLLAMMSRGRTPIMLDVSPNARVLAFVGTITIAAIVLFGLLPAVQASRLGAPLRLTLNAIGTERIRKVWGRAVVAAQVALLVVLLMSASMFAATLYNLRSLDAGFNADHVLVVKLFTGPAYRGTGAQALYEEIHARIGALPWVQSVSRTMDTPPLGDLSFGAGISVPGRPADPDDAPQVYHNFVSPRFFETLGIPLLAGRDFSRSDTEGAPKVVVISDGVARRYFKGEDPLGREIRVGDSTASIVGIVRDVRYSSLRADPPLMVYRSYLQGIARAPADTFLVRTQSTTETLIGSLQAAIRAIAPALPPASVVPLEDQVAAVLVEERMLAALSSAIGVFACILAAIGIYSTAASAVAARQREIGIRMALGALPGQIARLVVSETFGVISVGLAIGVPAALVAGRAAQDFLANALFKMSPTDPLILSGSAASILLMGLLASYLPARRASRIDSVAAIKYD